MNAESGPIERQPKDGRHSLASADLRVEVDPGFGAEICSIRANESDVELLARTPWHSFARPARRGQTRVWSGTSEQQWLSCYVGGWQTLFPNAGAARTLAGVEHGFHGEASQAAWTVIDADESSLRLSIHLFTSPLELIRELRLDGRRLVVEDTITNLAGHPVDFDYVQHPALGSPLVAPGSRIETGARTFVVPPGSSELPAGRHHWPRIVGEGGVIDLSVVPSSPVARYGWLTDFEDRWVAVRNPRLALGVGLRWEGSGLDYAWLWQELNRTTAFPWFGRSYIMALEPASTEGSGGNPALLTIASRESLSMRVMFELLPGQETVGQLP